MRTRALAVDSRIIIGRAWIVTRRLVLGVAFCLALPAAASNGYYLHGFSAAQRGMGGASTALSGEAAQLPLNPAGIVGVGEQWNADLNLIFVSNITRIGERGPESTAGVFNIEPGAQRSKGDFFLLPFLAYARAIDDDSAWGLSLNGGGLNTEYVGGASSFADGVPALNARCQGSFGGGAPVPGTLDPAGFCGRGNPVTLADFVQVYVRGGYARRFGDSFSLGISPIVVLEYFKASGLSAFDRYSVEPGRVSDQGHPHSPSLGFGGRFGLLWSPYTGTTLGASYQTRMRVSRFEQYTGLVLGGGRLDSPETWNLGLAWHPGRAHLLAVDFERTNFSEIPVVGQRFDAQRFATGCVLPQLLLGAEPSDACVGGSNGPGFGWRDTLSYKFGYRVLPAPNLALSLGYTWTRRPVSSSQALFNILAPGVTQDHYAAGLSWRLRPQLSFNIAGLYSPRRGVKGHNPLSNIDPSVLLAPSSAQTQGELFGVDPQDQTVNVSQQVVEMIVGLQFGF